MRVIAGKYRGRQLKSPASAQTRPTSDRLRETLFNVLAPRIEGARFLDLCAGTGAVGLEALSRGAEHVTFVDKSRKMCSLIEANTRALGSERETFAIVNSEATAFLKKCAKQIEPSLAVGLMPRLPVPFDIVFFDPPYAQDYESVLNLMAEHAAQLMCEEAVVVVEHYKKKELAEKFGLLKRYRTLNQGDSALSFYNSAA